MAPARRGKRKELVPYVSRCFGACEGPARLKPSKPGEGRKLSLRWKLPGAFGQAHVKAVAASEAHVL